MNDNDLSELEHEMLMAFLRVIKEKGLTAAIEPLSGMGRVEILRSIQKIERAIKSSVES